MPFEGTHHLVTDCLGVRFWGIKLKLPGKHGSSAAALR